MATYDIPPYMGFGSKVLDPVLRGGNPTPPPNHPSLQQQRAEYQALRQPANPRPAPVASPQNFASNAPQQAAPTLAAALKQAAIPPAATAPPPVAQTSDVQANNQPPPPVAPPPLQPIGQVSTGITTNPVGSDLTPFAAESVRNLSPIGGVTPEQMQALQSQYGSLSAPANLNAATNAGRTLSEGNAQHLMDSQQARSSAGLGWGNLAARLSESQVGADRNQQNLAMQLLSALGVL